MKIGFVVDYLRPYVYGGAETSSFLAAYNLALVCAADVTIFTPDYKTKHHDVDEDGYEWIGPVRVYRYWTPKKFDVNRGANRLWTRNWLYYKYVESVIKHQCRMLQIDILHAQTGPIQIPVYKVAKKLNIPCVATIRDMHNICTIGSCGIDEPCGRQEPCTFKNMLKCARSNSNNKKFLVDIVFKYFDMKKRRRLLETEFDKVIFVSYGFLDLYKKHGFDIQEDKCEVIYNYPPKEEI